MSAKKNSDKPTKQPLWPNNYRIPLMILSGPWKSGKTKFALQIAPKPYGETPNAILFDFEKGSVNYALQYAVDRFDFYGDLEGVEQDNQRLAKLYDLWWAEAGAIQSGQYDVLVLDPADLIGYGAFEAAKANPKKYGIIPGADNRAVWGAAKRDLARKMNILMERVETVVVIAHQRNKYTTENTKSRDKEARVLDTFSELTTLHLHLYRDPTEKIKIRGKEYDACPHYPTPMGIVMESRLDVVNFNDLDQYGDPKLYPLLPSRIEACSPGALRQYMLKPKFEFSDVEQMPEIVPGITDQISTEEQALIEIEAAKVRDAEEMKREKNTIFKALVATEHLYADAASILGALNDMGFTDYEAARAKHGYEMIQDMLRQKALGLPTEA